MRSGARDGPVSAARSEATKRKRSGSTELDESEVWLAALGARFLMELEDEGAEVLAEFEPRVLAQRLRRRLDSAGRAHLDHVIDQLHEWREIPFDYEGDTPWDPEEPWTGPSYDAGPTRATLKQAIARGADVEIDYFTHARGEFTTRRVTPREIDGRYFTAYCHLRSDDCIFRIERIARIKIVVAAKAREKSARAACESERSARPRTPTRREPRAR